MSAVPTYSAWRVSAGSLKGGRALLARPQEGTHIRAMYDTFLRQPASPLSRHAFDRPPRDFHEAIEKLRDYGLDIRHYSYGFYWLVGHTDPAGVYHDFIAHRVPA